MGPQERAQDLLRRVAAGGPNPAKAAEELDRLQASLERADALEPLQEQIVSLCAEQPGASLRGDAARAWLTLVGGFGLRDHAGAAAALALQHHGAPDVRIAALRVVAQLDPDRASAVAIVVLETRADAQVRGEAAEVLGAVGDETAALAALQDLLDSDPPRVLWKAAAEAVERIQSRQG